MTRKDLSHCCCFSFCNLQTPATVIWAPKLKKKNVCERATRRSPTAGSGSQSGRVTANDSSHTPWPLEQSHNRDQPDSRWQRNALLWRRMVRTINPYLSVTWQLQRSSGDDHYWPSLIRWSVALTLNRGAGELCYCSCPWIFNSLLPVLSLFFLTHPFLSVGWESTTCSNVHRQRPQSRAVFVVSFQHFPV